MGIIVVKCLFQFLQLLRFILLGLTGVPVTYISVVSTSCHTHVSAYTPGDCIVLVVRVRETKDTVGVDTSYSIHFRQTHCLDNSYSQTP